ncbi:MAG: HNH endonuclease [Gemmatimonadota bacterium]|nr:HNH endonuclease [Gemmatimonadota bacterium]
MAKLQRNYSQKTLKILFGLSGNQCAHPKCTNNVIEPATEKSDAAVIAQICHIYAVSDDGPRGKAGLTNEELNSPENLILLCPTHHTVVDNQYETYPAEMLKQWKQDHKSKVVENRLSSSLDNVPSNMFHHSYFPTELVDQKIKDETDILRKSRFFEDFDKIGSSLTLARKLIEGELSGGTDSVRCQALAWCVRTLSRTEELDKAEKYLEYAKKLGTCQEIDMADAFISSQKGNRNAALSSLANIDSPMSRSAALIIVVNHDGPQEAIDWLNTVSIDATDLDPDGKRFLLGCQLELADWEAAQKSLDAVTDDDLRDAPVLHHMIAITHLLKAVPVELRAIVRDQPPFEAAAFPLDSGPAGIEARRLAHSIFIDAAEVARQLSCPLAEKIDDEYALWLELRDPDPDKCAEGKRRLESKLRAPKITLRLVHLGLQFGIKLDNKVVEQEIERQIALNGKITYDTAIARFALVRAQQTPEDAANYIAQYHDEFADYIDKKIILSFQIELFSKTGQPDKANKCLDTLTREGLSEAEKNRLQIIISQAEGTSPVEALKGQFKETRSLSDLGILVDELEARNDWNEICKYGKILFDKTHERRDAERLAIALHNTQERERLVEFLESNKTLLPKSNQLRLIHCWSLYHEGKLLEARSELAKLDDDWNNENYRTLQVNLSVSIGDWNSLSAFIAKECNEKGKRNAKELITTARLALHLGSIPHAKELIFAAAERGKDDPNVLGSAYFLAASAGLEDDLEVTQWIQKATVLSGDDGPLQMMTLSDLLDKKPEWDRQESEIWEMLIRNELPMFLAAHSLNRSLSDLMLFPSLANLAEKDLRRKGAIPAYSGQRQPLSLDTSMQIGIDATALLTLSFLDLLDEALDAFDTVHIPHSTLGWLFNEKQRIEFHQPSRIRDASQIRDLLATGALEKFSPSTVSDNDLSEQVGKELALFIAEAEKGGLEDNSQHIVVQPSPVHRVSSLMQEEADLTEYATVLSSCQSIVDKLRQKGHITTSEEKKARAYLKLHEKPWPKQPEIADGAILYLDYLAVDYFLHLGILEKLQTAGFKAIISPIKQSETNQLISYESISGKAKNVIERIRSVVNSRIELGKIKVGKLTNANPSADQSISEHPTAGVFSLMKDCNAIVTDDRFLNQHANFGAGDSFMPIFSTLDLIDMLVSTDSKTNEERMEYRTRLRQAGYIFIPVSETELAHHLNASTVEDGKVVETAELKAIKENILCIRMRTWLQLPKETPWLNTSLIAFIRVMKRLWKAGANFSDVRVLSDWIMAQIDIRGWEHSFGKEHGDNIIKTGHGAYILLVLTPPDDVSQQVKGEYWSWVEEMILTSIKEQSPNLYSWIIEEQRRLIARASDMDIINEEATR